MSEELEKRLSRLGIRDLLGRWQGEAARVQGWAEIWLEVVGHHVVLGLRKRVGAMDSVAVGRMLRQFEKEISLCRLGELGAEVELMLPGVLGDGSIAEIAIGLLKSGAKAASLLSS